MSRLIDLHTHSTFSDGSMTPTELVAAARAAGLAAIALTDHDTCDGLKEFRAAGRKLQVETIGGIEISVEFRRRTAHLLGYGIDPAHEALREVLSRIVDGRNERNRQIIRKLKMHGVRIDIEEVQAVAGEDIVGRPHIAEVLIRKGAVADFNEAFDRYLSRQGAAYCERFRPEPEEAIALIGEAGGLSVLAHPSYLDLDSPGALDPAIERLKRAGLAGLEAYYPEHQEEQTRLYLDTADKFDLLVTGGSDFHGTIKPGVTLGHGAGSLRIPYGCYERLREALRNTQPETT